MREGGGLILRQLVGALAVVVVVGVVRGRVKCDLACTGMILKVPSSYSWR